MKANSTETGKTAKNEVEAIKAGKFLFICTLKAFESPLYIGIVKQVKSQECIHLHMCLYIYVSELFKPQAREKE